MVFRQLLDHFGIGRFDLDKMLQHFLLQFLQIRGGKRVGIVIAVVFIVVAFVVVFIVGIVIVVGRGVVFQMTQAEFVQQNLIRVDNGFDDFVNADFVIAHLLDQREDFSYRTGTGGNGLYHVFQGVFDFFGNDDFIFTRQQVDLPHFAHIHAYRIGSAAEFAVGAGEGCFGFFNGVVVSNGGGVVAQQDVFRIGCLFCNLDAQA